MRKEDYLRHYGVKGMKWRITTAPTKEETKNAEAMANMWDDPSGSLPTYDENGKLISVDEFTKDGKLISRKKFDTQGKVVDIKVNSINKGRDVVDKMISGALGKIKINTNDYKKSLSGIANMLFKK